MNSKYAILLLMLLWTNVCLAQGQQPNILVIQVDDLGYDDLSINGNPVSSTPNINQFATESVRFSNFMVTPVCSPSRGSLLTGRDFWRIGVSGTHGGNDFVNLNETTFADVFQENEYATGFWGKWHSGKADGYWPWDRGFDEAYYAKLYSYYPSQGYFNQYQLTTHSNTWSPTALVDYSIDFMDRKKDDNEPFLAYVSFLTAHDTWNAPESYISKYRQNGRTERFATLLGMLEFMDDEFGRLMNYMQSSGLDENTIILFMSDNGPNISGLNDEEWAIRNNSGFLGSKSKMWQNGVKSPLYIKYKDYYTPADVDRLVSVTDIYPTLLDMAGLALPASNKPLDGRSVISYLNGDHTSLSEKSAFFAHRYPIWEKDEWQPLSYQERTALKFEDQRLTLIAEDYKLLWNPSDVSGSPAKHNDMVLIDLNNHPLESTNSAASLADIADQMKTELQNWFNVLINSDGVFPATEHQIGWNGHTESEILAFAPASLTGALNDSHKLLALNEIGDQADYSLNVHVVGRYEVKIETSNSALDTYQLKVSAGDKSFFPTINDNNKDQVLGNIELYEGKTTLSIKIENKSTTDTKGFGDFKSIWLTKIGEIDNVPPELSIISPVDGSNFLLGQDVTFKVDATDVNNDLLMVSFRLDGKYVAKVTEAPFTYSYAGLTVGAHELKAVATDSTGEKTEVSLNIHVTNDQMQLTYEAEDATLTGLEIGNALPGYSGTGYTTRSSYNDATDQFEFDIEVMATGNYRLAIGYHAKQEKYNPIDINGNFHSDVYFPVTNNTWQEAIVTDVALMQGSNTITLHKTYGWVDIDYIAVSTEK